MNPKLKCFSGVQSPEKLSDLDCDAEDRNAAQATSSGANPLNHGSDRLSKHALEDEKSSAFPEVTSTSSHARPELDRAASATVEVLIALANPSTVENLAELFIHAAATSTRGVVIYPLEGIFQEPLLVSYNNLLQRAQTNARMLQRLLRSSPDRIVFQHFDNHLQSIEWFWAAILAGYVPAISPPFVNDQSQRTKHLLHINTLLKRPLILTSLKLVPQFLDLEELDIHSVENLPCDIPDEKSDDHEVLCGIHKQAGDLAVLMLTSGSTGHAKAVCLRHGQILGVVKAKRDANNAQSQDVFLNWIGLDHVASLTETHILAMLLGADQVQLQAADLLIDPLRILYIFNRHRVSYTFAPNFFLAALRRALESLPPRWRNDPVRMVLETIGTHSEISTDVYGITAAAPDDNILDLSSLRIIISGGEANVVETCAGLMDLLSHYRVHRHCIRPAFGMTETCAGVIYNKEFPTNDLERDLEFASVGSGVDGLMLRIVDSNNIEVPPNEIGDLQLTGPHVFREYFNNPEATKISFTPDGWFITGDRAYLDDQGKLNITGRESEVVIINGVKYFPHQIESALDEASIPGLTPSFTAVFPYRPSGAETDRLCVIYLPSFDAKDCEARSKTSAAVTKMIFSLCSTRPYEIIPLPRSLLPKTSLGKLSRAKLRKAFEAGEYESFQKLNEEAISTYRSAQSQIEPTKVELAVISAIADTFLVSPQSIRPDDTFFDYGISSVDLFRFKRILQEKLPEKGDIALNLILKHPIIRDLAQMLEDQNPVTEYSPVVVLGAQGTKTSLWLIHPGVGEVLVFIQLATLITDRHVYALRARGFEAGEPYFTSVPEIIETYYKHIIQKQPNGPYAFAGYSFGGILGFELTKMFEANGREVKFFASFNLPPHIKWRMRQLDWIEGFLHLAVFLGLEKDENMTDISPKIHQLSRDEAFNFVVTRSPPGRIKELALNKEKLRRWADLVSAMNSAAVDYDPSGSVAGIDVFYCTPLAVLGLTREQWREAHLSKWSHFTESEPRWWEVGGEHYTMLSDENVRGFHKKLKAALAARGI